MPDLTPTTHLLFLREESLDESLELLYLAARDLGLAAPTPLTERGLDQVHYRVMSFVAHHLGISSGELLSLMRLTKQSLSRAIVELQRAELIQQRPASHDRRQRLLYLTPEGSELEQLLTRGLRSRLARAYREAGGPAVEGFRQVLRLIVSPEDRRRVERTTTGNGRYGAA